MSKLSKQQKFFSILQSGFKKLGVVTNNVDWCNCYSQKLETIAGTLLISSPMEEGRNPIYSCYTRFMDVDCGRSFVDCNPFSGKWNFHAHVKDHKPEDFAQYILHKISQITVVNAH